VPTREAVESALGAFRGPIQQRPPDYSALKVGGRRAYDLARQGTPAELAPRAVVIRRLDLIEWDDSTPERPTAVLEVECGAGTYIRSLARDLGEKLGCGAYLGALVRTASGPFGLAAAHSLDEIRKAAAEVGPAALAALLLPVDAGLEAFPSAILTAAEVVAVARGQQSQAAGTGPRRRRGARAVPGRRRGACRRRVVEGRPARAGEDLRGAAAGAAAARAAAWPLRTVDAAAGDEAAAGAATTPATRSRNRGCASSTRGTA
jgi:tRNA pseudouridine55 synthase